ncbi:MAG: VacJ family lipoprotein, partial [Rhodospirillaceae bacterium]|nr:VacJ family lipoprotein [Rhodospirillaceae bacterium]
EEDFGQTLAVWGVGEGPYIMLPLFGPSNPRDAIGKVVDFFLDPINWWAENADNDWVPLTRTIVSGIDTRDQLWDVLDDLEKSSIDFYAAIRSLYRQRRNEDISNGTGSDKNETPNFSGDFELAEPDDTPKKSAAGPKK